MGRPKAKKEEDVSELSRRAGVTLTVGIGILAVIFLLPILVVLQNSFKASCISVMIPLPCRLAICLQGLRITREG